MDNTYSALTEKILLSRHDAAKALSVSVRSVDYMISRGELPARKWGKRTLIPRAALERFARGAETGGGGVGK